jgi:hypothetical protein
VAKRGTKPDGAAWSAALKHRPNYEKSLGAYFAAYQVKERGLKKWIEKARRDWIAAGCPEGGPDFPPFDQPPKMLDWWIAHMTHAPGAELYALAGKAAGPVSTQAPAAATSPQSSASPAAPATRVAIHLGTTAPTNLEGAVVHQRQVLSAAMEEHRAALADTTASEATITLRAKRVDDAMERLRTMESTLAKYQRENGDLVHRDAVRDDLAPLLSAMADSLVASLIETFGTPRAQATHFVDQWFGALRDSRFAGSVVPSHAPTTAAA